MDSTTPNMEYSFIAMPKKLFWAMDCNCRSVLMCLIESSNRFQSTEFFFKTNVSLCEECGLSANVIRGTLSALYRNNIIDVRSVGGSKGKIPNYFKLNIDTFKQWNMLTREECLSCNKHITTDKYMTKGWTPSYLEGTNTSMRVKEEKNETHDNSVSAPNETTFNDVTTSPIIKKLSTKNKKLSTTIERSNKEIRSTTSKAIVAIVSDHKNYNSHIAPSAISNEEISQITMGSPHRERRYSDRFIEYKQKEDDLFKRFLAVKNYTDFKLLSKCITILYCSYKNNEQVTKRTAARFAKVYDMKIRDLIKIYGKDPFTQMAKYFYDDVGQKYISRSDFFTSHRCALSN